MSDPQPIAEWSSRYQGYHPQFGDGRSSWIPRVDAYAKRVRNRWMYILLETRGANDFLVAFEAFIDEDAHTTFCGRTPTITPASPIPERGEPLAEGWSGPSVSIPMTDDRGRALDARLLFSSFRLPSTALARLSSPKMRKELRDRIPPLWQWEKGKNETSPLQSRDGFSLVQTPLWMDVDGQEMRVWVGSDPFEIAVNRSEVYCAARQKYLDAYEPTRPYLQRERARLRLAQAIDNTILRDQAVLEQYGKYVDVARLNRELERDEKQRRKAVKRFETAGAALCQTLDSPLFRLYQEASLSEGGIEQNARSEPLGEHIRVLGLAARMLGECSSGQALLALWAEESEKDANHFVNLIILPATSPNVSRFKSFRWGSKALATFLAEFLHHKVRVMRIGPKKAMGELLQSFGKLGVGDAYDPVTQIIDMKRMQGQYLRAGDLNLDMFEVEISKGPLRTRTVKFGSAGPELEPILADWVKAGSVTDTGRNKKLLDGRTAGAVLLDAMNLAVALKAVFEAEGGEKRLRAFLDSGAAAASIAAVVVKEGSDRGWISTRAITPENAKLLSTALRGVVSLYYASANTVDAVGAFRSGDNDRGYALSIAAAAELAAFCTECYLVAVPASLVAPWLLVAAGVTAAAAYIAAVVLKDDPLELFLTQCAWGIAPYVEPDRTYTWADEAVSQWRNDYPGQARTLMRVLLRLTASWDLDQWPAVTVQWGAHDTGARLEVKFVATTTDGKEIKNTAIFEGADLPVGPPFEVVATPPAYTSFNELQRITATVRFRLGPREDEEVLTCSLMEERQGITKGKVTRVS